MSEESDEYAYTYRASGRIGWHPCRYCPQKNKFVDVDGNELPIDACIMLCDGLRIKIQRDAEAARKARNATQ